MKTTIEDPLTSSTPLRDAHCQRIAALSREIARQLPQSRKLVELEPLAWLHDCPREIFRNSKDTSRVVQAILQTGADDSILAMGEILSLANSFDEMIEWLPVEHQTVTGMLSELSEMNQLGLWRPEMEAALRGICKAHWETVLAAGNRLPVKAVGEVRKLAFLPVDDVSIQMLYQIAAHDPVLTGDLLRVVNSWAFPGIRKEVTSLREALNYLGTESARAILVSSAARTVFVSKTLEGMWKHSLEVAAKAQALGEMAGCDPELSFICGLMHDIGRLAIEMLDPETLSIRSRLSEPGIPVVWVDLVTCRHDHAEIGGALLWRWNFPRTMVEAVSHHHAPEQSSSKLASVLYLAERMCHSKTHPEDTESPIKFGYALKTTGLTLEQLGECAPSAIFASLLAA